MNDDAPQISFGPDRSLNREQPISKPVAPGSSHSVNSGGRLAFSVSETAIMLGVCDKTVRRLVHRGLLRPSKALRHLLISRKEIDRFLEETT